MAREQVAQFAQACGDVETGVQQGLTREDFVQGNQGFGLAGQQHLSAPLVHVADIAIPGAASHQNLDTMQRMRAFVLEVMRQLFPGEFNPHWLGQLSARLAVKHQPVAGGVAVACTRKHVPGTKALSAKAVRAGGGIMHRLGLSESLLVFAEHRLFLDEPPAQTVKRLRQSQPEKKIVVEVANLAQAAVWAKAGADVLQLEKFTPEALAACRLAMDDQPARQSRPLLAAAGGIRADNAAAYVAAGADFLVTSAPYTAAPRDVQVDFGKSG